MTKINSLLLEKNKSIPLNKYTGEWIAFTRGKTIAHSQNLGNLMERLRKSKKKKASIMLVPKKSERNYIVLLNEK
jgi:sensor histidine kinase regulating citrate/malate metabolism